MKRASVLRLPDYDSQSKRDDGMAWPQSGAPVKISREDVLRVAELAHLELSPDEVELYRGQLDEILSYIGKLQELDVSLVGPMTIAGDLAAAHLEAPEPVGSQSDRSTSSE